MDELHDRERNQDGKAHSVFLSWHGDGRGLNITENVHSLLEAHRYGNEEWYQQYELPDLMINKKEERHFGDGKYFE